MKTEEYGEHEIDIGVLRLRYLWAECSERKSMPVENSGAGIGRDYNHVIAYRSTGLCGLHQAMRIAGYVTVTWPMYQCYCRLDDLISKVHQTPNSSNLV